MITCFHCDFCCEKQAEYRLHLNKLGYITCQKGDCPFFTEDLNVLEVHYRVVHQSPIKLQCGHCNVVFTNIFSLSAHVFHYNGTTPTSVKLLGS